MHPDVIIVKGQKNKAVLDVANNEINVEFDGVGNLAILELNTIEFGLSLKNKKLVCKVDGLLPVEIITRCIGEEKLFLLIKRYLKPIGILSN